MGTYEEDYIRMIEIDEKLSSLLGDVSRLSSSPALSMAFKKVAEFRLVLNGYKPLDESSPAFQLIMWIEESRPRLYKIMAQQHEENPFVKAKIILGGLDHKLSEEEVNQILVLFAQEGVIRLEKET